MCTRYTKFLLRDFPRIENRGFKFKSNLQKYGEMLITMHCNLLSKAHIYCI